MVVVIFINRTMMRAVLIVDSSPSVLSSNQNSVIRLSLERSHAHASIQFKNKSIVLLKIICVLVAKMCRK